MHIAKIIHIFLIEVEETKNKANCITVLKDRKCAKMYRVERFHCKERNILRNRLIT